MSSSVRSQAQALRALADRIEQENTPLPPTLFAPIAELAASSALNDPAWLAELERRAGDDETNDVSLEDALRHR